MERAIALLDGGEAHLFGESVGYDLRHEGRLYPPKAVVGVAARLATGTELGPDDFSGGEGHGAANSVLRSLGFDVVPKDEPPRVERTDAGPVWLEITQSGHGHGGEGWEFGTCLWSPSHNRGGRDAYRIMGDPAPGDRVLHCMDSEIVGQSVVSSSCVEVAHEPPLPGSWAGMAPYFRIDVTEYAQFETPLPLATLLSDHGDEIRRDIGENNPRHYPFCLRANGSLRTVQGGYLTKCSPSLHELIARAVGGAAAARPVVATPATRVAGARYWCLGAGEGARFWSAFYDEGLVAIGGYSLGDLRNYATKADIAATIQHARGGDTQPINDAHAFFQFCHEIKTGDFVLVKRGRSELLGFGQVTTDYQFRPERREYEHVRQVQWSAKGSWQIPADRHVATKALTDVTRHDALLDFILPLVQRAPHTRGTAAPVFTLDDALKDLFLERKEVARMLELWARKKNLVLEGAPGVGKTFIARRLAYAMIGYRDRAKVEMVQFHQSYAYEDFIQGWRPKDDGGFALRDGVFHQFCSAAADEPSVPHVFIVDEINRGNLSKILGELMMLIESDKRGPEFAIPLTYASDRDETFFVPENLYVLGLMNTADRSLAMVDYALRRRFTFMRLRPAFGTDQFKTFLRGKGASDQLVHRIAARMRALNEHIASDTKNLGPGFEVGHSFFCPQGTEDRLDDDWYEDVISTEVEPLPREYWFDNPETVERLVSELLA